MLTIASYSYHHELSAKQKTWLHCSHAFSLQPSGQLDFNIVLCVIAEIAAMATETSTLTRKTV